MMDHVGLRKAAAPLKPFCHNESSQCGREREGVAMVLLVGVLGAILGSIVASAVAFATTRTTMRMTLEHTYDQTLQNKRVQCYQALFYASRNLPRYWPPTEAPPTRQDLHGFIDEFFAWHYGPESGGLYLTPDARERYFRLTTALAEAAYKNYGATGSFSTAALSEDESQTLRSLGAALRQQLAEDIGAANPPHLKWTRPTPAPPAPQLT